MIAQQKDAEAVLATLWDVNDASTSRLMSDFYSRWVAHPADGKAEALRQAQLAFFTGRQSHQQKMEKAEALKTHRKQPRRRTKLVSRILIIGRRLSCSVTFNSASHASHEDFVAGPGFAFSRN